ncbi:MAG TPA: hypothetical protein VH370_22720 [Humisphaera sp.]|jgi:hypothetical protein|nr:hypothetical protein [Humisphaera sp.]
MNTFQHPAPRRRETATLSDVTGKRVNIAIAQFTCRVRFQVTHDHLWIARVPLDDQVSVIMTDAAGETGIIPLLQRAGKSICDRAALRIIKAYGWKLQGLFRSAAQCSIVRIMSVGSSAGHRGRRAKFAEFPGPDEVGPRPARIVW